MCCLLKPCCSIHIRRQRDPNSMEASQKQSMCQSKLGCRRTAGPCLSRIQPCCVLLPGQVPISLAHSEFKISTCSPQEIAICLTLGFQCPLSVFCVGPHKAYPFLPVASSLSLGGCARLRPARLGFVSHLDGATFGFGHLSF